MRWTLPTPTKTRSGSLFRPRTKALSRVAHFAPADDPEIFKLTAQAFMQGPASYVGYDVTDNGGHLEPSDTNIQRVAFGHTFSNYEIEFNENDTTPFDYNDYSTDGLNLYFREEGTTGTWQRFLLEIPEPERHARIRFGQQPDGLLCRRHNLRYYNPHRRRGGESGRCDGAGDQPPSSRTRPGVAFKSFVDEDDLGHVNVGRRDEPRSGWRGR